MKIDITATSLGKVFALVGKLVRYAQGGFTQDEKSELIGDLLEVLGVLAEDIGQDIRNG